MEKTSVSASAVSANEWNNNFRLTTWVFLICNRTQMLLIIKASMSVQKNREQQPPSTLNAAFVNGGCCCSSMSLPGVAAGEERGQQPDNHWTLYPRPTITKTQPQYLLLPRVYTWMRKRWIKSPQQIQTCVTWHSHFITQLCLGDGSSTSGDEKSSGCTLCACTFPYTYKHGWKLWI